MTIAIVCAVVAAALASGVTYIVVRSQVATAIAVQDALKAALAEKNSELASARQELALAAEERTMALRDVATLRERVEQERATAAEKLSALTEAHEAFKAQFAELSAAALRTNTEEFLKLAQERLKLHQSQASGELEHKRQAVENLVKPLTDALTHFSTHVRDLESKRTEAYTELKTQLVSVVETQQSLRTETGKLVNALRAPHVRGRWGEIQLRRVVEIAGMVPFCDFQEQASVTTADGRLRPDLIVRLPGGKQIVVDAKAPLSAYLEAVEATDDDIRRARMLAHATQIKDHMAKLGAKNYWEQFDGSPEFVVMFLPGEVFFSAALEQMPALIESGVEQKVIPASPTTLIAMLRAVNYGWQQAKLAENAKKISDLGKRLYDSLRVMAGHMEDLGSNLDKSMKAYNRTVGSLERNVLSAARKFPELGVGAPEEIEELQQQEEAPRLLQAADWITMEEERSDAAKA
ncbi:MAG TPA: DNA recombination protein RmuC [Clostridia bacterium]|nr:DNA recombination protein RmuC [Clostridia bacterium]